MIKLLPTNGQIYLFMMNLLHMVLTLYWVWSNFWTTVERCFIPLRSKFTCTHQIKPTLTLRSCAQHVFFHPPKSTPTLKLELRPYIHQIKMPISHPENCASSYIPCIHYCEALFHLFFRQQQRNGLFEKKEEKNIWEKPKGKRGKSIPVQKKIIAHFLLSSSYHSNKRESCCKEWPRIFRIRTSTKNSTHMHIRI